MAGVIFYKSETVFLNWVNFQTIDPLLEEIVSVLKTIGFIFCKNCDSSGQDKKNSGGWESQEPSVFVYKQYWTLVTISCLGMRKNAVSGIFEKCRKELSYNSCCPCDQILSPPKG